MTLLAFLRRELAPAPGRFRAAARILVGCVAALILSLVIGGNIAPHGHWVIITVFTLSQADVGASTTSALPSGARAPRSPSSTRPSPSSPRSIGRRARRS